MASRKRRACEGGKRKLCETLLFRKRTDRRGTRSRPGTGIKNTPLCGQTLVDPSDGLYCVRGTKIFYRVALRFSDYGSSNYRNCLNERRETIANGDDFCPAPDIRAGVLSKFDRKSRSNAKTKKPTLRLVPRYVKWFRKAECSGRVMRSWREIRLHFAPRLVRGRPWARALSRDNVVNHTVHGPKKTTRRSTLFWRSRNVYGTHAVLTAAT